MSVSIYQKNFTEMFRFAKFYEKSKASINKQDPRGVFAIQALEGINRDLVYYIKKNFEPFIYDVSHSQGGPSLPRVTWVSVTPRRTRVSYSPSYTICFGRKGDGFVHGLMLPAAFNLHDVKPVIRTKMKEYIDIDGTKVELKYNDRYINPVDVHSDLFDEKKLIEHMETSLNLLDKLVGSK